MRNFGTSPEASGLPCASKSTDCCTVAASLIGAPPRCGLLPDVSGEGFHVCDGSFGENAMPQVKNVPWSPRGAVEDLPGSLFDLLPGGKQYHRVQIALYRNLGTQLGPACIERDAPVESNHVGARFLDLAEKHRG